MIDIPAGYVALQHYQQLYLGHREQKKRKVAGHVTSVVPLNGSVTVTKGGAKTGRGGDPAHHPELICICVIQRSRGS